MFPSIFILVNTPSNFFLKMTAAPFPGQRTLSIYSRCQKIQVIRRNQVYFSSSNVSTVTTIIIKDQMLNEKFTFCFRIYIKWKLTKSYAETNTHVIEEYLLK